MVLSIPDVDIQQNLLSNQNLLDQQYGAGQVLYSELGIKN